MTKILGLMGIVCLLWSFQANAQIIVQGRNCVEPGPAYVEVPCYAADYPLYPTYAIEAGGDYERRHGDGHRDDRQEHGGGDHQKGGSGEKDHR